MSSIVLSLAVPTNICDGAKIRTRGTKEFPLFRVSDLCRVLGIQNASQVASRLDEDEKTIIYSKYGGPGRTYANESGFYKILATTRLRKDNPKYAIVKAFQNWVFQEVLPSIRKHGSYPPPGQNMQSLSESEESLLLRYNEESRMLINAHIEHGKRISAVEKKTENFDAIMRDTGLEAGYKTISCYVEWMFNLVMEDGEASQHGRRLTQICKARGIHHGQIAGVRYLIHTYNQKILREYAPDLKTLHFQLGISIKNFC